MTAKIVHWDAKGLPAFTHSWSTFSVIDPDKQGAVVMHEAGEPVRALPLDDPGFACGRIAGLHTGGPIVLIIEHPFAGKNAHQAMESGMRTGSLPGLVAGYADARIEVIWLYPATWQASLRKAAGIKGTLERDELKKLAMAALPQAVGTWPAFLAGRKEQKQAIADGCAMGRWWNQARGT